MFLLLLSEPQLLFLLLEVDGRAEEASDLYQPEKAKENVNVRAEAEGTISCNYI